MSLAIAQYLARRYGLPAASGPPAPRRLAAWQVRRVAELVDARLGEGVRIAELASLFGMSVGYFHRAFRAATGTTPLASVNDARVRRAVAILTAEQITVAELALRVGFSSPSYFARVFRRATGMTPAALRRRSRGRPNPPASE